MDDLEISQIGFLGSDPKGKTTSRGFVVVFDLCSTSRYKDRTTGEAKEVPTWLRWEMWGTPAENFIKYIKKGSHVQIKGTIRNNVWFDEGKGENQYKDSHVALRWKNLDRKSDANALGNAPADKENTPDSTPPDAGSYDDDSFPPYGALPPA